MAGGSDGPGAGGHLELRKATHKTIDEVTRLVESTRLNVAVARLMELVSAARRTIDAGPGAADPAVREAAESLAIMLSLFAPYTAEECWEMLGHDAVGGQGRVAGRRPGTSGRGHRDLRDPGRWQGQGPGEVATSVSEEGLRELALANPAVERALAGRGVRTVIVRPPKLVNVVSA